MAKQATHASTQHTIYIGRAHFNWYGTALQQAQQLHMAKQATHATAHSIPFALAQHTSTGTALRFNWHSNCIWQNTSYICNSTQHTICIGTAHFNWYGIALQLAQQLHMAKQATYATAHSSQFALAQHTSTGMALHFNWHSNCIWHNKYVTAHSHITTSKKAHQFTLTKQATRVHITARQLHMAKQATYATAHSTPLALAQHTSTGMALHFNLHSNCIWQNKLHMQQLTAHNLHWHSTLQLVWPCTSTGTAIAYGKTSM